MRACAVFGLLACVLGFTAVAEAGEANCNAKRMREICARKPANNAPTISGTPSTTVVAGQAYTFTPAASDPDGNALSFAIVNRPPWASFSASTGRLSGTPTSSSAGEYGQIGITVSDGSSQASLASFSITVSQANHSPTIAGTPLATAREGQAYEFTPLAADSDCDALTFTISNRPSWATFSAVTGTLRGTPAVGSVGTFASVTIRVSDGVASTALPSFSIAVQQASSGSATLSWLPPTTRIDGSPLLGLAGYHISYGTSVGSYPNRVVIPNGGVTSAVVGNLPPATYYFVISAYDSAGVESDKSPAVTKTIS